MIKAEKLRSPRPWPAEGLEFLGLCPVCGETKRTKLYEKLHDRLYGAPGEWTLFRCSGCGCGYLDPRPTAETIHLAYEYYITHKPEPDSLSSSDKSLKKLAVSIRNSYLNKKFGYHFHPNVWWGYLVMHLLPPHLRLEWDHYARHLPRPKPDKNRLLDVGCGNGFFLSRAKEAGWNVLGIEFDPKAANLARRKGIKVLECEYKKAPLETNYFDVITSDQVLEHVMDPMDFISRLANWLKPGGYLWVGTPNFNSLSKYYYGSSWRGLHPPYHLSILNSKILLKLLARAGMEGKILRRGYYESHIIAESETLRRRHLQLDNNKNYNGQFNRLFLKLFLEFMSFLFPSTGSDLVVLARKANE